MWSWLDWDYVYLVKLTTSLAEQEGIHIFHKYKQFNIEANLKQSERVKKVSYLKQKTLY